MTPEERLRLTAVAGSPAPEPRPEPPRRLSPVRIGGILAVAVLTGLAVVGLGGVGASDDAVTESGFAPYVDVTATPTYAFENPADTAPGDVVLAFVVSSPDSACTPSWGAAYSLDEAADALDLDRRVARLQQLGGTATVSFGGAANSELAIGCTDPDDLADAYRAVVERYSLDTIDLDIEGAPSFAPDVVARRAEALAAVQSDEQRAGRSLGVWLTLPVGPDGLTGEGAAVLAATLEAGVRVAGVNAMVMNYGESLPSGRSVAAQAELSLVALHDQIRTAHAAAGTRLSEIEAWQLVGATPMIGRNDTGEVFDLDDASRLLDFAGTHGLRRLFMWSANRDQDCGPNYPDLTVVSDQCSGVTQPVGGFGGVFQGFATSDAKGAGKGAAASPAGSPGATPSGRGAPAAALVDDPATSPYPVWNATQGYAQGTKVVWHRNVYQAKWFSLGSQPDAPVTDAWETPWSLLGPVLPGERPAPLPTVPPGTYPVWRPAAVYRAGTRVVRDDVAYQAKWWTQGDLPGAILQSPYDSPWQLVDPG